MASSRSLAHPYANAVFALAKAHNDIDHWLENLSELAQVANNKDFINLIDNPKFSPFDILAIIEGFVKNPNRLLGKLLITLQESNRLVLLSEIFVLFEKMAEDEQNKSKAIIQSAYPMSDMDKADFERLLGKKYGRKITATVEVNTELIGGIKVLINDTVIDASVKGSLHKMAAEVIG